MWLTYEWWWKTFYWFIFISMWLLRRKKTNIFPLKKKLCCQILDVNDFHAILHVSYSIAWYFILTCYFTMFEPFRFSYLAFLYANKFIVYYWHGRLIDENHNHNCMLTICYDLSSYIICPHCSLFLIDCD